jgi:trehalose 6-phosphate phosphatase
VKNILRPAHREVLAQFAFSNVLLAFDYDGTLAPIARVPERAAMRPPTRELMTRLARLYPCVVISGRAGADARTRVRGVGVRGVVGNHGVETWHRPNGFARDVLRWHRQLQSHLAGERGVVIENKGCSIAIHYRRARRKSAARAAILRAVAKLRSSRLIHGKQVVNVLPRKAPHKGDALERERARLRCDTAIYVGDDDTDEDVFSLDQPGRLLSIRVGAKRSSRAEYCVRGQRQIDGLISTLVRLRSRP